MKAEFASGTCREQCVYFGSCSVAQIPSFTSDLYIAKLFVIQFSKTAKCVGLSHSVSLLSTGTSETAHLSFMPNK